MEKGKITINIGNLKIDYEGSEEFIKNDFNNIFNLEKIATILKDDVVEKTDVSKKPKKRIRIKKPNKRIKIKKKVKNISDLLSVLNVNDVDDLIIGTLAYYYFLKKVKSVPYSDLYYAMRNTGDIFENNIGKTKYVLGELIENERIIEKENERYGLCDEEILKLEKILKNHL